VASARTPYTVVDAGVGSRAGLPIPSRWIARKTAPAIRSRSSAARGAPFALAFGRRPPR